MRLTTVSIASAAVMALLTAGAALAQGKDVHSYPTVDRVEFVLECMQKNASKQEYLYKCACEIDEIAKSFAYDDYVEASTAARYQTLAGDRGGEFRDPPKVREAAKRYMQVKSEAMKRCDVPR